MRLLRKILIPPLSSYTTYQDKYKFNLVWRMFIILSIFFFVLASYHLFSESGKVKTTTLAFLMSIGSLVSLKVSKKYSISVFLIFTIGTLINQYTIYTALNVERIVDLLWMITISVFVFFMLGSKYGVGSMLVNILGLIGALFYVPKEVVIQTIQNQTLQIEIAHAINIIVATSVTVYVISKIIEYSDYNERKIKEVNVSLVKQRDEKVIMLKEIHHRVKNNLQIVSSLLRLQANIIGDSEISIHFNEAVNRISSMALIHEKMYQTENLSDVNLKEYLNSLFVDIFRSYSFSNKVSYEIKTNIKSVSLNSLVPLALIFNELITNSIKHAFTDLKEGKITVEIKQSESTTTTTIIYKDNGKGYDSKNKENFGSVLIETFTEQLEGEFIVSSVNGVEYVFTFNDLK